MRLNVKKIRNMLSEMRFDGKSTGLFSDEEPKETNQFIDKLKDKWGSFMDAAKRESKEECGSCEGERFDHFYRRYGSQNYHTFIFSVAKPFEVKISDEHKDFKWVPLKDVEDMNLHPKFRGCLKVIFSMIKKRYPIKISFLDWVCRKN